MTTKPDGPINLVFWGNNFQTRSATALYQYPGDNAYGKVKYASSGWVAYNDRGYKDKNALFQCGWDTHYRVYGSAQPVPTPNTYWGYFYIGQVHHDYNDGVNCGKAKFGWHEDSEKRLAAKARTVYGDAAVQYDQVQMLNPEGQNLPKKGYADGNHWRSNDGRATKIHVCSDNQFLATKCTASGAIG